MLEYWFLFPLGVVIAVCAMSSSISGSSFWTPVYLLWLALEPKVAFWVSLLTMLFGFGSGVYRNLRDGTWSGFLVGRYLLFAGPATLLGAMVSAKVRSSWLLGVFAVFVLAYGSFMVWDLLRGGGRSEPEPRERIFWPLAIVGGLLQGTVASGVGVLVMPAMLRHRRVGHHAEAVGSAVILVFVCSLVSVLFRVDAVLFATLVDRAGEIGSMILYAAPGVVVGGQLGPRLARRLPRRALRLWVAVLLIVVGVLVGYRALS